LVRKVLGDKAPSCMLMSAGNVIESIQKEGAEAKKVKKDGKKYAVVWPLRLGNRKGVRTEWHADFH